MTAGRHRFDVAGRTALVTGGTAGIGLALTERLVATGARRVIIVGRDAARLAAVAAAHPGIVVPIQADLCDVADTERLLATLGTPASVDLLGADAPALSLVINNAGMQLLADVAGDALAAPDTLRTAVLPALRAEIATNLTGVVGLSVGLLPQLARQPSAAIVNISSGLALAPKRSAPVYCATKAAVRSFTRALRYQCEARLPHVRIVEALPPLVDTPMTRGRGRGKISAAACAAEILEGLQSGRVEVYVGRSKLLRAVMRVAPAAGYRLMRDG